MENAGSRVVNLHPESLINDPGPRRDCVLGAGGGGLETEGWRCQTSAHGMETELEMVSCSFGLEAVAGNGCRETLGSRLHRAAEPSRSSGL